MTESIREAYRENYEAMMNALRNERIALAIERATAAYRQNLSKALAKYPHTVALADEVRKIKERSVQRMESLVKEAMDNIPENKGQAYFAKTADDARRIVGEIVGSKKSKIVKAKSLTCEEIDLRQHLQELGNEVWETDLGELILQLRDEAPMHILSPSIHVPKEDVAELFSKVMGKDVPPDIASEVAAAREFLRQRYVEADLGISGANIVSADTGSLFIIENEGNARLSTGLPSVHIAIVGVEKLVPTMAESFKVAEVTWRYAQYAVPSYVNIISGPSKTGDIEKVTTYGAHGPKETHVVFVDNGRSEIAKDPALREALYCLRCGGCMYECPVYALVGGKFGYKYFIGYGAAWIAYIAGLARAAPVAYTCLRCGRCVERCPVKIDTGSIISRIRGLLVNGYDRFGEA
ncbi:LUD domain-containing protein [[Eubacterium] cellulosolvens]